jgi:pimeloyl-ACP methyl ester carboxylesterase
LTHWAFNALFPEEEICNAGILGGALLPDVVPIGGRIMKDFRRDLWLGKLLNFYAPYSNLNWNLNFPMSGTTAQLFREAGVDNEQSVYVIRPKDYDEDKAYPVVFFMHGYLGNWKLYNGVLKDLDDCIVMGVGTHDLSGIYRHKDISELFTRQLPFLEKLGMKADKDNLHIIGLSNGGSVVNVAYNSFSRKFKTITFISTGIYQTYPIRSKVLLIGGGKDGSSGSLPGAYNRLKRNGTKVDMYWQEDEGHFIFVNDRNEIVEFLNKNIHA